MKAYFRVSNHERLGLDEPHAHEENVCRLGAEFVAEVREIAVVQSDRVRLVQEDVVLHLHHLQTAQEIHELFFVEIARDLQ